MVIGKYKGIKFQFMQTVPSHKNSSAAFEELNRCQDDVKEWMPTSKLKLIPDKTEFIVFGSKRQRDKLKAYFTTTILGSPLCPAESVKNLGIWFNSDFYVVTLWRGRPRPREQLLLQNYKA